MIKLKSLIIEASGGGKEKVYMLNGMLWLSYSPNSGRTKRKKDEEGSRKKKEEQE